MANSAGGTIIYGIAEGTGERQHLPESLDPINRQQFSREWLEQVIGTIEPRIQGLLIHPVELDSTGHVAYVVEIPQGTTAHQARDFRYYHRYNFESVPMPDYQIRDVMNRVKVPDLAVAFDFEKCDLKPELHAYRLMVVVRNTAPVAAIHWKLEFMFPNLRGPSLIESNPLLDNTYSDISWDPGICKVSYCSDHALFPDDSEDLTDHFDCRYWVNDEIWNRRDQLHVAWTLYADNMPKKTGQVPFSNLQCF